eukprot:GDKJ01005475.1.p1 GENE.GDKJ01005475.1~~GDKJ01005475.1.p1  ORF type:complete len:337 (+),score=67.37 GDKJ01005475.1:76-1086(+)
MSVFVPYEEVNKITQKALENLGHSVDDAKEISDMIIWAQSRGNNQSLVKLPAGGMDPVSGAKPLEIQHESKLGIKVNGNRCPGIVALKFTTNRVIEKVKEHGMAIGAVNHTCTGTGPIGYYARKIAEQGFVALVACQTFELMAPYGGFKPLFGTNPLAYGIPRKAEGVCLEPIVYDSAMSGISFFGLHELKSQGKPVPKGLAFDSEGNETEDAIKALSGALRVFDNGPKSSGLAMMVELLGAMAGGDVLDKKNRQNWGSIVIAIDPNILGEADLFFQGVEEFVARYKAQPALPGHSLTLPGERSAQVAKQSEEKGGVEVMSSVWEAIQKLAQSNSN